MPKSQKGEKIKKRILAGGGREDDKKQGQAKLSNRVGRAKREEREQKT